MSIEAKLQELDLRLPEPTKPSFQYLSVCTHDGIAYLAGQIPKTGPTELLHAGKVGREVSLDQARACARLAVLHGLSWLRHELGGLDRVERILRLDCYVAVAPGFLDMSRVIDAASELLVSLFGDRGRHPRSVLGVAVLPRDAPVLVEMTVAIRP